MQRSKTSERKLWAVHESIAQHIGHKINFYLGWVTTSDGRPKRDYRQGRILRVSIDLDLWTVWTWVDVGERFPAKVSLEQLGECGECRK